MADRAGRPVRGGAGHRRQLTADGAVDRARAANATLLPQGLATPRMLILAAVDETGRRIGQAWIGLDHPRGTPRTAFLYDLQLDVEHRGRGLGKALLAAV